MSRASSVNEPKDQLEKLAARVDALQSSHDALTKRVEALQRASFRYALEEKFRPRLFGFRQYKPRPLEFRIGSVRPLATGPTIGIVTPSLNSAGTIEATVASVLAQSYPHFSYVVQDGGSADATVEKLRSMGPGVKWRSEPDEGQADAINKGFRGIDAEIMGYLNADDLLAPDALNVVAGFFLANPSVDVIYSNRIVIDEDGHEVGRWVLPRHDPKAIYWADYIPQETMFWRKRVWDALGGLDPSFRFAMDWDFILRAHQQGFRFKRLRRFLACFRVHPAQKTSTLKEVGEEESGRLRVRYLGFNPNGTEVNRQLDRYIKRHVLHHRLYKLLPY